MVDVGFLPESPPTMVFDKLIKEISHRFHSQVLENSLLREDNEKLKVKLGGSTACLYRVCEGDTSEGNILQMPNKDVLKDWHPNFESSGDDLEQVDHLIEKSGKLAQQDRTSIVSFAGSIGTEQDDSTQIVQIATGAELGECQDEVTNNVEDVMMGLKATDLSERFEAIPRVSRDESISPPSLYGSEYPPGWGGDKSLRKNLPALPTWFTDFTVADSQTDSVSRAPSIDPANLVRQQEVEKLKRDPLILTPLGSIRLSWDLLWTISLVLECWITPFDLVFIANGYLPDALQATTSITFVVFCTDILLSFFTGYIDAGNEILERRKVIARYLQSWFLFDILVTLPWDRFVASDGAGSSSTARASQAFRAQKLFKLLRLVKVFKQFTTVKHAQQKHVVNKLIKGQHAKKLSDDILSWLAGLIQPLKVLITPLQMCCLIGFLSHLHGALWAWIVWEPTNNVQLAFERYWQSLWWAFSTFTFGNAPPGNTPGLWTLDLVMMVERVILVILAIAHSVFKAMVMYQDDAKKSLRSHYAMAYLKQHDVSVKTQVQMLFSVNETGQKRKMLHNFERLLEDGIPHSLQTQVREELWSWRLNSLALIQIVNSWEPAIVRDLCQRVSEESYASRVVLFKQGDAGDVSYLIISGTMLVFNAANEIIPPYTKDMWLGERALVNPGFRRSALVISNTVSALLRVPAKEFHRLLEDHALLDRFQEYVCEELWKGLCGRCGSFGDHFPDECPSIGKSPQQLGRRSSVVSRVLSLGKRRSKQDQLETKPGLSRDLVMYLNHNDLSQLTSLMEELGILNLDAAEENRELILQESARRSVGPLDADEEGFFSRESIQDFRDSIIEKTMSLIKEKVDPGQHFIFLSHYKAEAGTEAALMRSELAALISNDEGHPARALEAPIFLDSEDLIDLRKLCKSVVQSHNLVIMLTKDILSRPWCIVEIATAVRYNVSLVPVQIIKPTKENFQFPDEQFYKDMADGVILGESGNEMVLQEGFDMESVCQALRRLFEHIALPYSPHKSAAIRRTELKAILKQCVVREIVTEKKRLESIVGRTLSNRRGVRKTVSIRSSRYSEP